VVRLPTAAPSRAVVRVVSLVGPAATVVVSFDRPALVAGGAPATVTARALDAGGNPVAAQLVLDASAADLSEIRTVRPGEVVGRLAAGERLRGDAAVVSATAPELGISGARSLALRPDSAATGGFAAQRAVRGAVEVALRVEIADRFGNPVSAAPEVTAARGKVLGVAERGPGSFDVRYLPPAVDRLVQDALVARSGAVTATLDPIVAPRAPALRLEASAGAGSDLGGRFVAGVGTLAAERPADLGAALRLGLEPALRVEAGVLAASGETLGTALAGGSVRGIGLSGATLSASATVGIAFREDAVSPAGRIAAALALPLAGLEPFLELSLVGANTPAHGAFAAATLSLGARFGLEDRNDRHPDRR
jgi:hypothetical protein